MRSEYRKRQSLFTKEDHVWRVENDALIIQAPNSAERHLPRADIVGVRLAYAPTRMKTWRYVFVLQPKRGKQIEIDNAHFRHIGSFENRSASYVAFVEAALERIRHHAPQARAQIGSAALSYVLNLLFVSAMLLLLVIVLIMIPTPLDAMGVGVFVRIGIIAVFLPALFRWIKKERPRGISLDDIPPDALPKLD